VVVKPRSAQEVSAAIIFANNHGIPFTACGGGHATSGTSSSEGGMVIHLEHLNAVSVDPVAKTVTFGGGCRWSDVDDAAWTHGLATVGGTVSHTGVGGLILGGGFGFLTGLHGLTIDVLLAVEVVLADGSIVTASATENTDLFWALRGAGASFGVVTSFTSRAFSQGNVWAGALIFSPDKLDALVEWAGELIAVNDGKQFAILALAFGPPPERHPCIVLQAFHNGSEAEGRAGIFGKAIAIGPIVDMMEEMPYPKANALGNELFGPGQRWLFGAANATAPLDPSAFHATADKFYTHIAEETAAGNDMRSSIVGWELMALDKVLSVDFAATAFANRGRYFNVATIMNWTDPGRDGAVREWNRELAASIRERGHKAGDGTGVGQYANYLSGSISAEGAFGSNAERLVALKARYDATNRFDKVWKLSPTA
jgi:hypothetical protein